jgi:serine/threonine protein kinase
MGADEEVEIEAYLKGRGAMERGTFHAGDLFGEWRIVAFIGKGGTSEVYRVQHVELGTYAALKVLMKASAAKHFLDEAKILSEVKEECFPHFYTYGEAQGHTYYTIEILEPGELPRTEAEIAEYVCAVAKGMGVLHKMGFVHRDLKPQNILFRKGHPVLIDFGLVEREGAQEEKVAGTPLYAAPEQFIGAAITRAVDIHALGVLANQCFGKKVPRYWEKIISRATSSIPKRRYQSAEEFIRDVRYRKAGRFAAVVVCAVIGAAVLGGLIREELKDPFPRVMRLNGQVRVLTEAVRLKAGREYWVIGPGTLDAEITGGEGARLCLTNCVVLNRSKEEARGGLKYSLEGNVYLNFINRKDERWEAKAFVEPYDRAYNAVEFGGPATVEGLMGKRNAEWYRSVREGNKGR